MAEEYYQVVFNTPVNQTFTYKKPEKGVPQVGVRVKASFGRRHMTGFIIGTTMTAPEGFALKAIDRVIDAEPLFGRNEIETARWLARLYFCSTGEALSAMLPGGKRESRMPVLEETPLPGKGEVVLSADQQQALEGIGSSTTGFFYIRGVTGSGKTEVFLRLAEKTIAQGSSVIYLVPEISLTHQLTEETNRRFSGRLAILHSGLTPSQKLVEWQRIRSGEARIILGARSAVFAPAADLGLIIIDEEHETSYKSGHTPRYHARQIAMRRCRQEKALLVMGSATPSLEAWHMMEEGVLQEYRLSERISGGTLPEIRIANVKKSSGCLSKELRDKIQETYDEGKQTILFLNRRGFSYFFHCHSCGYEARCRHCSVSLTYHKGQNRLVCHYCGYSARPQEVCPECGSLDVGYSGFGTEMIEKELRDRFPHLRIGRVDADSTRKKGSLKELLESFHSGELDILLGTQMVAKGLNFPGVKLVGIVLADTSLHLPDFRAAERTFQLLVQVAGRAGRFSSGGEVLIQTYDPKNPVIRFAAGGELDQFYAQERKVRQELGFPPYARLFRVVFRGKKEESAEKCAEEWSLACRNLFQRYGDDAVVLGPAEAPLFKISGSFRFHTLIKTTNFTRTHGLLNRLKEGYKAPSGIYLELDPDPVSLL